MLDLPIDPASEDETGGQYDDWMAFNSRSFWLSHNNHWANPPTPAPPTPAPLTPAPPTPAPPTPSVPIYNQASTQERYTLSPTCPAGPYRQVVSYTPSPSSASASASAPSPSPSPTPAPTPSPTPAPTQIPVSNVPQSNVITDIQQLYELFTDAVAYRPDLQPIRISRRLAVDNLEEELDNWSAELTQEFTLHDID